MQRAEEPEREGAEWEGFPDLRDRLDLEQQHGCNRATAATLVRLLVRQGVLESDGTGDRLVFRPVAPRDWFAAKVAVRALLAKLLRGAR